MNIKKINNKCSQYDIRNTVLEELSQTYFDQKEYWDEFESVIRRKKESLELEKQRLSEDIDDLTLLYNKESSKKKIIEIIKSSKENQKHALMLIDIVNFSGLNKALGYMFGDNVLVNIADALKAYCGSGNIIGRIGGDEFIIFIPNVTNMDSLMTKVIGIHEIFNGAYTGEDLSYKLDMNSGIAIYPQDSRDFISLFNCAHQALQFSSKDKDVHSYFYEDIKEQVYKFYDYSSYEHYNNYYLTKKKVYGTKNFDNEIISFAFDIMSKTKDIKSAINLLLCKVRENLKATRVSIVERIILGSEYHITYSCSRHSIGRIHDNRAIIDPNDFEKYLGYFDDNGIVNISSLNSNQLLSIKKSLLCQDTKAVLQCGIFEHNALTIVVNIEDNKERVWLTHEIESIITITKIISTYILKLRTSEEASKQLFLMKNYDALTGMPTLYRFRNEVIELIQTNPTKTYGIIYINIHKFRLMNEMLGYDVGDNILRSFSSYLRDNFKYDSIGRVSDDKFVMLVQVDCLEHVQSEFLKICEQYSSKHKPKYPSTKFIVTSGISRLDKTEDISSTIDNANLARKQIIQISNHSCQMYEESMKQKALKELHIASNMELALKEKEFIVYIQPKIALEDERVVGGEALVRWLDKDKNLIPPNEFIPIFEKNGFIIQLDYYIYEEVLKKMKEWKEQKIPLVPISLNVSRIHLNDENFVHTIKTLIDTYEIPYEYLELELTESIFLSNLNIAIDTMTQLRELGMKVSIDDFGSGYSSLNLLKNMSMDVIKLDKEFFSKGDEMQKEEKIIVSSIIGMAKQLNLKVLSEGVETKNQSEFLKSVKCDMAQGYLYAKPMPFHMFEEVLRNRVLK